MRIVPSLAGDTYSWAYFMGNEMLHIFYSTYFEIYSVFSSLQTTLGILLSSLLYRHIFKVIWVKARVIKIMRKMIPLYVETDKRKRLDEWRAPDEKNIFSFSCSLGYTKKNWKKVRTTRPCRIAKYSVYASLTRLHEVPTGQDQDPWHPC